MISMQDFEQANFPLAELEYINQRNQQMHLHGFRVDLSEIEAVCQKHPQVQQAVVTLCDLGAENMQLVAYVLPKAHRADSTKYGALVHSAELRNWLAACLPEYMVPVAIVVVDSLSLLPDGTIDRRALPEPEQAQVGKSAAFVAPRSELEAQVSRVWSKLLGVGEVGVHDNFFALGGDSLLAIQAVSRIRSQCQVGLGLRCIFEAPTVAEIALLIERTEQVGAGSRLSAKN